MPDRPDYTALIDVRQSYIVLDTNFREQTKGVEREPEWRAAQGYSKWLGGVVDLPPRGMGVLVDYTVPDGKVLMITDWGFAGHYTADPAYSEPCPCHIHIYDWTAGIVIGIDGSVVGRYTPLNTPAVLTGGKRLMVIIYSNHDKASRFEGGVRGYEYEVTG